MYRNYVQLQGRLGADAEFRTFDDGGTRATMRVATTKKWRNKAGEPQERTQWHNVVLRLTSEAAVTFFRDKLKKGYEVDVDGELTYREYQKDGSTHYITEVVAERIQPIPRADESPSKTATADTAGSNEPPPVAW